MEFQGLGERGIDIGPPIFTQKRKIEEKMSEKQLLGKLRETVQQLLEQNERAKQMAEMSSNSHLYSYFHFPEMPTIEEILKQPSEQYLLEQSQKLFCVRHPTQLQCKLYRMFEISL